MCAFLYACFWLAVFKSEPHVRGTNVPTYAKVRYREVYPGVGFSAALVSLPSHSNSTAGRGLWIRGLAGAFRLSFAAYPRLYFSEQSR
jgi:hypothetical protein